MALCAYLINLDRDIERLNWMKAQAVKLGINLVRLPAVLGASLPRSEVDKYRHEGLAMTAGEVGCLLSHIKAWRAIAEGDEAAGLVLEDDMHLSPNLAALLASLSYDPDRSEIFKLEASTIGIDVARDALSDLPPYKVHALKSAHSGTGAYAMSRETARRLLTLADTIRVPVDLWLFAPAIAHLHDLRLLQLMPAPCIQDRFITSDAGQRFESRIGDRASASTRKAMKIRDLLRPFFRSALAVSRLGSDVARRDVRYL